MARLVYFVITSLDGYVADESGAFDWARPDEEVHAFVNDLERSVGTYLYGRRMYDVMRFWESALDEPSPPPVIADFATIWQGADKVVYSSTLPSVSTARTRLERVFDPDAVRGMKTSLERDVSIGGPNLAAHAIRAGLVDEWQLLVAPVVVGSGTHWLPGGVRGQLQLRDERRFGNGMVFLRYDAGWEQAV